MVQSSSKPAVDTFNAIFGRHGIPPIGYDGFPQDPMIAMATRLYMDTTPGMEFPGYQPPPHATYVGYLPPATTTTREVTLPTAVTDPDRTVIVVSQGTLDNTDPGKLIIPTLEGLRDEGHTIVVTTGGANTDSLRTRYGSDTVVIEDYIPYDTLFPHTSVFVSNGGFGSNMAALVHGVPLVTAGTREGKNDNNVRLAVNHLAVDLRTETPKPARIRTAVQHALSSQEMRAAVRRVQAELATYDAYRIIEDDLHTDAAQRLTDHHPNRDSR